MSETLKKEEAEDHCLYNNHINYPSKEAKYEEENENEEYHLKKGNYN